MFVDDVFFGYTLEPQRKGSNETSHSNRCVNTGKYVAEYEYSAKFKKHLIELKNVRNRTEIKIHSGNFRSDTRGCILVGLRSGVGCVLDSRLAVDMLNEKAKWVSRSNEKIEVEVKEYLPSDEGMDDEIFRNSRK